MKKTYLASLLLLVTLLFPLSSGAFEIGARGYYWFPSLDGTFKVDEAAIIGTTIELEDDLGMEDESYPSVEVFLGAGNHHLSLMYTGADYSGRKTLTKTVTFNGQTFSGGALVTSSIEYKMIDFSYQYDFVNLENVLAGFSIGAVFQVKYLDGEVSLKTTGIDETEDFGIPIPMLGLNLHMGLLANILEARVRATGIGYSGNMIYEAMGEISWTPFPFIDIHGGYKTVAIDVDEEDVIFDYDTSGPYVALTLSF